MQIFKNVDSKKIAIVVAALGISGLFLMFAFFSYPVPAGDSIYFLVPAVQFAAHGALTTPLYPSEWMIDTVIDPTGARRFLFYPPLFPLLMGLIMPQANAYGIFWAIAVVNSGIIFLSAVLFYKITTRLGNLNWSKAALIALALVALAASLAETGRPEVLARLFITIGALVPFYVTKKNDWIPFGILLGLMFATHPAGGIFSLFVLGVFWGITRTTRELVFTSVATLVSGLVVSLATIAAGPFGAYETIASTIRHARVAGNIFADEAPALFTLGNLFRHYIASPAAPFYGLIIILSLVGGAFLFKKYGKRFASPRIVVFSSFALVAIFAKVIYFMIGHVFYFVLFY